MFNKHGNHYDLLEKEHNVKVHEFKRNPDKELNRVYHIAQANKEDPSCFLAHIWVSKEVGRKVFFDIGKLYSA